MRYKALDGVVDERQRQIEAEGWTEVHDDLHDATAPPQCGDWRNVCRTPILWLLRPLSKAKTVPSA